MAIHTDLSCPSGQDRVWSPYYATPTNISGFNFAFYITDLSGDLLLAITTQSGAISITDVNNGKLNVTVTAAQMATIQPQECLWQMWRTDSGHVDKLGYGLLNVYPGPPVGSGLV